MGEALQLKTMTPQSSRTPAARATAEIAKKPQRYSLPALKAFETDDLHHNNKKIGSRAYHTAKFTGPPSGKDLKKTDMYSGVQMAGDTAEESVTSPRSWVP